jgi:hypothetical protein
MPKQSHHPLADCSTILEPNAFTRSFPGKIIEWINGSLDFSERNLAEVAATNPRHIEMQYVSENIFIPGAKKTGRFHAHYSLLTWFNSLTAI